MTSRLGRLWPLGQEEGSELASREAGSCLDPARPCEQLKMERTWEHGHHAVVSSPPACAPTTREGRRHLLLPISQYPLATGLTYVHLAALGGTCLSSHVKLSRG